MLGSQGSQSVGVCLVSISKAGFVAGSYHDPQTSGLPAWEPDNARYPGRGTRYYHRPHVTIQVFTPSVAMCTYSFVTCSKRT